jgi:hypothetical protein
MFCPKCATANSEQAKFCRACGTNLETVALALAGQLVPPGEASHTKDKKPRTREDWLEKWGRGARETVQGAILLAVYLLVGFALMAVLPEWRFEFVLIWLIVAGGAALWGIITLARGIGGLFESKAVLREMERIASGSAAAWTPPLLSDARQGPMASGVSVTPEPVHPPSVTEHTTQALDEHRAQYSEIVPPEQPER